LEDIKIIDLYFARDQQAIAETKTKYGPYLATLVGNILHDPEDTEEVVADTYLNTWRAIPPTRPRSLKHFLSRISRNLSFMRLRSSAAQRRSYETVALLSEFEELIPDGRGSAEDALEAQELGRLLDRFLSSLSPEERVLFLSRYFYAASIRDIARRCSLTERQVKYRLSLLRSRLKAFLESEDYAQ